MIAILVIYFKFCRVFYIDFTPCRQYGVCERDMDANNAIAKKPEQHPIQGFIPTKKKRRAFGSGLP